VEKFVASTPPRDGQTLEAQLERLLSTPTGSVIYDQLVRIVAEWKGIDARVEQTYCGLLRVLLEDFAHEHSNERVLFLAGRLIQSQARHAASFPVANVVTAEVARRLMDNEGFRVALVTLLDRLNTSPTAPLSSAEQDKYRQTEMPPGSPRTNPAARHTEARAHSQPGKTPDTLALKMRNAIDQSKQLGDLLRIEMGALQQADSVEEIATFRQILIGAIEELLQGQEALAGSLQSTSEYMRVVDTDSERLFEELNKVRQLSLTDEYTGLPNRRAFTLRLDDEIGRAQRYTTPLALAILDLDEFKVINDTYGHAAGDQVLRCYADHILSTFRHHDMVARYGGEEFSVLLPNTALDGGQRALQKLQKRVAQSQCELGGRVMSLPTFSAGITLYIPGEAPNRFIERADRALYRAKHLGRNRTELGVATGQSPTATEVGNGSSGGAGL
jgi:diguanylate cyclase (GGDEF)-like protein